ncbi:MAG: hypothetical protein JKY65_33155, partial [Planctomycetes bacterium]|nr:hypothetical protein [Planctomycetota bacterium]
LTLESFAPDSDRPKVTARLVSGQVKYPEYAMSSFVLRLSPAGLLGSRTTLRHVLVNRLEPTAEGVVVLGEVNYRAAVIPARGRSLTVDLACRGRDQGLLASLDADCKAIWAAQISGMSTRLDVAAVSSGSIYVGGVFKGEGHLLGPVGKVSVAYASQGQIRRGCVRRRVSDLFLARLDLATGELRWSGQLKGHGPEGLWSLRCFGDRLYLAGWQQGALTYRRGAETFSTFESPTGGFLLSVDRRGRGHVWEGFPVPGGLQGVRVLGPNRVALYGTTSDTLTLGGRALPFRGGEDAYLAELQLAPLRLGRVVGLRTKARGVALLPLLGRNLRLIGSHDEQVVVGGKLTR